MNEYDEFLLVCPCGKPVTFMSHRAQRWNLLDREPQLGSHPSPVTVPCRRCGCAIRVEIIELADGRVEAVVTRAKRP